MLFLFDYDGVIADSFDSLLEVCIEAQAVFGQGRAPSADDFRTIENLTFDELGGKIGIPKGKCDAYGATAFAIQREKECPCPFLNVVEVIQKLAVQWITRKRYLLLPADIYETGQIMRIA